MVMWLNLKKNVKALKYIAVLDFFLDIIQLSRYADILFYFWKFQNIENVAFYRKMYDFSKGMHSHVFNVSLDGGNSSKTAGFNEKPHFL